MVRFCKTMLVLATAAAIALPGCNVSRQQMTEVDLAPADDSSLYDSMGLHPEIPAVSVDDPFQSAITLPPITINEEEPPTYWELTLEEATRLALSNSRIMRDLGATVLRLPTATKTIQDPAITETDARFGTEAALSQFDAHFLTSGYFEKNDRALNNVFFGGGTRLLQQDANVYQTQLTKRTATGAQLSLTNNTDYDSNNAPGNLFYGSWTTNIEAQVKQPLLAGGGVEYNRVYGPNGIPGLPAGVMLARVNTEQSLADFEIGVRNFVSDVENAYWDLYFAYRDLDARILARDAALETWRRVNALHQAGKRGGEAQQEAQAREQYFRFQEEVQNALTGRASEGTRSNNGSGGGTFRGGSGVHFAERRLRLMIGSHISDGRLIRPADEPKMAKAVFEWDVVLAESLTRRPELRKQKWLIKRREMEVSATKNLLQPRLDATGLYRWRGFGKQLMTYTDPSSNGQFASAWGNLLTGNFQEWQLGFEFEVPLGFRHAHNAVRNYELMLARERSILNEQERAVVLDLSNSIGELNRSYTVMQTNHNRRISAKQQLAAIQALDDPTPQTLYLELESQRRLADAEAQYYRALVEYELAIKNVHFEKGSLLEYNGVVLAELPWPDKAYKDAYEKIRLRTRAGRLAEKTVQGPDQVVSEGVMPQGYLAAPGSGPTPETVPPPAPEKSPLSPPKKGTPIVPEPAAEPTPVTGGRGRPMRQSSPKQVAAQESDDFEIEQVSADEPTSADDENELSMSDPEAEELAEGATDDDTPDAGEPASDGEVDTSLPDPSEDEVTPTDDEELPEET
ncbi:MAG TPA: TolC family protein [Planctomycetaceae bacterium]|nr:TolC family protein [Planctomycetaceae bacterium]